MGGRSTVDHLNVSRMILTAILISWLVRILYWVSKTFDVSGKQERY